MNRSSWDLIVAGSGAAGLSAALAAAPRRTLVLTKTESLQSGSTPLAQGGIAAAAGKDDSAALHSADTLAAGAGFNDELMVRTLSENARGAIEALAAMGMPFDRNEKGEFKLSREGSHSLPRVVRSRGDSTGASLSETLAAAAARSSHITLRTGTMAIRILRAGSAVGGLLVHSADELWSVCEAPALLLASGGAGQVFAKTTNPAESTGDGPAMAMEAGIPLRDMEFIQFHPTALDAAPDRAGRVPLITEALRGAGAALRDEAGRSIMEGVHPLGNLAPRDIAARTIRHRTNRGRRTYLDARSVPNLAERFPTVVEICRRAGIDPRREPIPVAPAAHYFMGGIAVGRSGETALPGLYAVGECAGSRLHGANRLASNSLLECLVFADQALRSPMPRPSPSPVDAVRIPEFPRISKQRRGELRRRIQGIASAHLGILRSPRGLAEALVILAAVAEEIERFPRISGKDLDHEDIRGIQELRSILSVARAVAAAASSRRSSLGAHCVDSAESTVQAS